MEQVKPLSPNIKDIRTLVYEINRSNDTLMAMLNELKYKDTGESLEIEETEKKYHLFGGSKNTSFAVRYLVMGEISSSDLAPNNSIYTTGNNIYWIKDNDGVSREIASSGSGGAYLPIDGKAADSDLLDGLDSSYFTPLASFNNHVLDDDVHFEQSEINHNNIINNGLNTHAQIDSHISDSSIHFLKSEIDHGVLSGLAEDDHPQYLTTGRGDVRYLQLSGGTLTGGVDSTAYIASIDFVENGTSLSGKYLGISAKAADSDLLDGNDSTFYATASGLSTHVLDSSIHFTESSIDHGSISGLGDDDHTQYYNQTRGDARYLQLTSTAESSNELKRLDTRSTATNPLNGDGTSHHLKYNTTDGLSDGGTYHTVHHIARWSDVSGGRSHQVGYTDNGNIWHRLANAEGSDWGSWYKLWHSGNDGSGSTLDADMLDGNHGSYYAPLSTLTSHTSNASLHFTEGSIDHGSISGLGDDDHTQYLNQTRGDARYLQLTATAQNSFLFNGFDLGSSGNRFGIVPLVAGDGVVELGKYIDFHETDNDTSDYSVRITTSLLESSISSPFTVTDSVRAYNSDSEGSYIGLFKGPGSLPGYSSNRFPTLKSDHTAFYFSAGGRYSGGLVDSAETSKYLFCRNSVSNNEARLYGDSGSYAGLYAKYGSDTAFSTFNQNASGGAIELKDSAGTSNCLIRSYGVSYFNGGNVGIGTSSPFADLQVGGVSSSSFPKISLGRNVSSSSSNISSAVYVYNGDSSNAPYASYGMKLHYDGSDYGTMVFAGNQGPSFDRFVSFGAPGASDLQQGNFTETMKIWVSGTKKGQVEIDGTITQDSWTDATLATGWSNKGTPYSNVRYRKDKEGYLRLSGVLSSTPANGDDPMFTLPVGYRPTYEKIIGLMTNSGYIKAFVRTTGVVQFATDVSVTNISFDGTIISLD